MNDVIFDVLSEHCMHRTWTRGIEEENKVVHMCSYKDGKCAKCWDDWQECAYYNCYIAKNLKNEGK